MAQPGSDSFRSTLTGGSDSFRSTLAGGSDSLRSTFADGSDSFRSTFADGSDSFRSILGDGSDSFRSTFAGGSDSFRSTFADGSDSLRSTFANGSDSLRSTLAVGSDSFRSTLTGGSDSLRLTFGDGIDSFRSTFADGSDSFRSILGDESDSFRSILAYGSDSLRSSLVDESDSLMSALANGSDSFRSILADGSDSFKSALEGGHDYMFETCCDLCEQDGLQKEAIGLCVDCQHYLCKECSRNHLKPKPSRHHVLLDQYQMSSREAKKTRAQHVMDIQVRDDNKKPCITGCVALPRDKLVVVDDYKVKLVDLTHNKIIFQLELTGKLWDITQVGSKQVAVTSYKTQTINVINVKVKTLTREANSLKLDHTIEVKGRCHGIASINEKLLVSYKDPVKVEIISMTGQVLHTVVTEDKGRGVFKYPLYVAVNKKKQLIYISDSGRNTVTSVDVRGQVQATYKDDKLRESRGLTVDSAGRVYVCGVSYNNNILQLTADLTEIQVLLQQSDGVVWPASAYYREATDRLYIGMWGDVVKVYQLN